MNSKIDSDTTAGLSRGHSVVGKDADIIVAANRTDPAAGLGRVAMKPTEASRRLERQFGEAMRDQGIFASRQAGSNRAAFDVLRQDLEDARENQRYWYDKAAALSGKAGKAVVVKAARKEGDAWNKEIAALTAELREVAKGNGPFAAEATALLL